MRFEIEADTGISGTFNWTDYDPSEMTQDEMRAALRVYGDWIYDAGGQEVAWERHNHWNPKLAAAKVFTLTILKEKSNVA